MTSPTPTPSTETPPVNATDAAASLAAERGIDLRTVMGTGSDGKITKPDVEAILGEAVSSGDGSDGPQSIMISVPVAPVPPGVYLSSHVEVQRLTQGQRTALRIMCEGLDRARGCLANGKRVRTNADVVRWLLERAATILASSDNGSGA